MNRVTTMPNSNVKVALKMMQLISGTLIVMLLPLTIIVDYNFSIDTYSSLINKPFIANTTIAQILFVFVVTSRVIAFAVLSNPDTRLRLKAISLMLIISCTYFSIQSSFSGSITSVNEEQIAQLTDEYEAEKKALTDSYLNDIKIAKEIFVLADKSDVIENLMADAAQSLSSESNNVINGVVEGAKYEAKKDVFVTQASVMQKLSSNSIEDLNKTLSIYRKDFLTAKAALKQKHQVDINNIALNATNKFEQFALNISAVINLFIGSNSSKDGEKINAIMAATVTALLLSILIEAGYAVSGAVAGTVLLPAIQTTLAEAKFNGYIDTASAKAKVDAVNEAQQNNK